MFSGYGREDELTLLSQWIVQEHSRMVSVLGMGGIGKSALAVSTMYQQAEHFEIVIFRSLRDAPSCEVLLDDCLQVLAPQSQDLSPSASFEQRISLLLSLLRTHRVLVVLDNLESLLQEGEVRRHFRPGFEGYGQLLRRVAETGHQSCLVKNNGRTHMYEFAWRSPAFAGRLGACHGLDIPFVFDLLDIGQMGKLLGNDPPQQLAEAMHSAWVSFATHGDPGWPPYELSRRATMRFDLTSELVEDPHSAERVLWEGLR